jgi:hypothetical protein
MVTTANKAFRDAARVCGDEIGISLTDDQRQKLHRMISKQGYPDFHAILQECLDEYGPDGRNPIRPPGYMPIVPGIPELAPLPVPGGVPVPEIPFPEPFPIFDPMPIPVLF